MQSSMTTVHTASICCCLLSALSGRASVIQAQVTATVRVRARHMASASHGCRRPSTKRARQASLAAAGRRSRHAESTCVSPVASSQAVGEPCPASAARASGLLPPASGFTTRVAACNATRADGHQISHKKVHKIRLHCPSCVVLCTQMCPTH